MTDNALLTTNAIPSNEPRTSPDSDGATGPVAAPASRAKRILRAVGWVFLTLFCLILFTVLKLPEDRIKNLVQGTISNALAAKNISFAAGKGSISLGWGISYVMNDVVLSFPPPQPAVKLDQLTITPSLLSLTLGKMGASFRIEQGGKTLKGSGSLKGTEFSANFDSEGLDLGKAGLLQLAGGVLASLPLTGEGKFSGDTSNPSTIEGELKADIGRSVIEAQSIMGFSIPKLNLSEGKLEVSVAGGKALFKTVRLGKPGNAADDIRATLTGDAILGKTLDASTINAKATLAFSETVMKAFVLLDALLGAGKQPDGSYAFQLQGPLLSPAPAPIPAGAAK